MTIKKTSQVIAPRSIGAQWYVVGPSTSDHIFRSSTSGGFTTRVMSSDAFQAASGKANTAIREALKHPPKVGLKK